VEAWSVHQLVMDHFDHSEYDKAFAVALGCHNRPNRSRTLEGTAGADPLNEAK
jgi:hypothetical protein